MSSIECLDVFRTASVCATAVRFVSSWEGNCPSSKRSVNGLLKALSRFLVTLLPLGGLCCTLSTCLVAEALGTLRSTLASIAPFWTISAWQRLERLVFDVIVALLALASLASIPSLSKFKPASVRNNTTTSPADSSCLRLHFSFLISLQSKSL